MNQLLENLSFNIMVKVIHRPWEKWGTYSLEDILKERHREIILMHLIKKNKKLMQYIYLLSCYS